LCFCGEINHNPDQCPDEVVSLATAGSFLANFAGSHFTCADPSGSVSRLLSKHRFQHKDTLKILAQMEAKNKNTLRIIFMGTPDFAVASLDVLVKAGYNIVGVITAPDKTAGRGRKLKKSEVKLYAETAGLKILQPVNLKDPVFLDQLKALQPNLGIVVAFRMLPETVWSLPELGTFNLHASLLPQYRGAAPINHAIINGERETGVTTFFLKHEIDTGNIIFRKKVTIEPDETYGQLHDKLKVKGAQLVLKTVKAIEEGNYKLISQHELVSPDEVLKTAPKIFKDDCRINWRSRSEEIHNLVRGLNPVPAAFSYLRNPQGDELQMKIFRTHYKIFNHNEPIGALVTDNKNELAVYTADGIVTIDELQMEGKSRMMIKAFLNGFKFSPWWKFV
jgi:methionyl-tRNA formyltransferase